MIDIYICEDNVYHRNVITQFISNYILIEDMDMKVVQSTSNPLELLETAQHTNNTGLFFLDIDLQAELNGLQLAKEIRILQPRCYIIFITSYADLSFMTFQYKVEALDYIVKDNIDNIKTKIKDCLLDVNEKYLAINSKITKNFIIKHGERRIPIDYNEIIFFEISPNIHKIILHGKKRTLEFNGQLKEIESQVNKRFYRCHRSYLINLDNITYVDFNTLTVYMKNTETCPISIRAKKGLKKLLEK